MGGFTNPVFGGNTLIRPAIQSPNFVPGSQGWAIRKDGSAELNDLTLRGMFVGTDYVINDAGLFFYSGTPAAGNLVGSWAQADGTDDYGNPYTAGISIYNANGTIRLSGDDGVFSSVGSGGVKIYMEDGALSWQWAGEYSDAGFNLDDLTHGRMSWSSGTGNIADRDGGLIVTASPGTPVAGSPDTSPRASTVNPSGSVPAHHYVSGAVVKANNTGDTAETWHAPVYNTGWSGPTTFGTVSGGLGTLQYRMDGEDNVWLLGTFTAASGAGSSVFNLPAAYRPKHNFPLPVAFVSSTGTAGNAWMYVSSAGNLNINSQLGSAVTAGTAYTVNAKIPLGNIGT